PEGPGRTACTRSPTTTCTTTWSSCCRDRRSASSVRPTIRRRPPPTTASTTTPITPPTHPGGTSTGDGLPAHSRGAGGTQWDRTARGASASSRPAASGRGPRASPRRIDLGSPGLGRANDPVPDGESHRLESRVHSQLGEDVLRVGPDRVRADRQGPRDLNGARSPNQLRQHFAFP